MIEKRNITAVISIFNMEKYLHRFMDSFLQQKYIYEIILVDDGSTDSSALICDEYRNNFPDFIKVIHKKNEGLSSARNAGIEVAKGKYIIFPDPDDWVEANYTQRMIELQEQYYPDLVCIGHYINYDNNQLHGNVGQTFLRTSGQAAQKSLIVQPCVSSFAWDKLYHLEIIQKYKLRFLDDVGTREDVDFAYRYLEHCKSVCYDPESRLYHYYQRSGAATHSGFSKKKLDALHAYEKIIESTDDEELIRAAREEICNVATNLVCMYKNDNCDDPVVWRKIRKSIQDTLKTYLNSKYFGVGRKVQAILAYGVPSLYVMLKKYITKG